MSITDNPVFTDAEAAREWLESTLWPEGPICPHCGMIGCSTALNGKSHRPGLWKCKGCDGHFTVTVGTVMERSHIPLNKWLLAMHLMGASKKGMSAHQMHRMLGLTYKSAWFMCHRIREAMREGKIPGPLGGANKVVEVDETYVGGKAKNRAFKPVPPKEPVVALVERGGRVRSHHVATVDGKNLKPILKEQIDAASHIMTDESPIYPSMMGGFAGHSTVNHSINEYVRGGFFIHTNTVENYFSIFKRGIIGTYHHVSATHLKRYLGEFDFRYNLRSGLGVEDGERMTHIAMGVTGKRLTYRRIGGRKAAQTARHA